MLHIKIIPVDKFVSRSPRPEGSMIADIKSAFGTVISLEGLEEDAKETAELSPVLVISKPISTWQIYLSGISQLYLDSILTSIDIAIKTGRRVLVHCEHGEDRTGLAIAAYRVRRCGWGKDAAMAEAIALGYRHIINIGLNNTWGDFRV
jgi:hypothetical protein